VLIASPSDVVEERQALRAAIWRWNDEHAASLGVVLLPVGWETHSRPELGEQPQALIDRQVVADTDVVIGVFWTRLGTPTPDAASGTVHEIKDAQGAGKHVLLYFSDRPVVPGSVDLEQLAAVHKFKLEAQSWGLIDGFDLPETLVEKARTALLRLVREYFDLPTAVPTGFARQGGPRLLAEFVRAPGGSSKLYVANTGDAAARNVRVSRTDGLDRPEIFELDEVVPDLPQGANVHFLVSNGMGGSSSIGLQMVWSDDAGREHSERQTIRL
jgi:hypothetical protein